MRNIIIGFLPKQKGIKCGTIGEFSISRNPRFHLKIRTNNGILNEKEFRILGKYVLNPENTKDK